ncbi:hypothetical protein NDU88_006637 [Pleurodeles waltl]|uniref:Uncharacterized protein n=1 Tax=Pleurodeles waltl TaxID=8319 RepID=A0AAV7WF86_PLEWA|nr:hypothetical protein NDU88_006637 [Pleurodeles waltl]
MRHFLLRSEETYTPLEAELQGSWHNNPRSADRGGLTCKARGTGFHALVLIFEGTGFIGCIGSDMVPKTSVAARDRPGALAPGSHPAVGAGRPKPE